MMLYFVLKYLHVIGAAVLLGTGAGIAFFCFWRIAPATPRRSPRSRALSSSPIFCSRPRPS
jgi:uncharacterized membrane protein